MGMNPETQRLEPINDLTRPLTDLGNDATDWTKFSINEHVVVKGESFRIEAIGETTLVLRTLADEVDTNVLAALRDQHRPEAERAAH